ncbi:MAG: hypothetical protein ACKVX7_10190 [Planctomycetota bacterium]
MAGPANLVVGIVDPDRHSPPFRQSEASGLVPGRVFPARVLREIDATPGAFRYEISLLSRTLILAAREQFVRGTLLSLELISAEDGLPQFRVIEARPPTTTDGVEPYPTPSGTYRPRASAAASDASPLRGVVVREFAAAQLPLPRPDVLTEIVRVIERTQLPPLAAARAALKLVGQSVVVTDSSLRGAVVALTTPTPPALAQSHMSLEVWITNTLAPGATRDAILAELKSGVGLAPAAPLASGSTERALIVGRVRPEVIFTALERLVHTLLADNRELAELRASLAQLVDGEVLANASPLDELESQDDARRVQRLLNTTTHFKTSDAFRDLAPAARAMALEQLRAAEAAQIGGDARVLELRPLAQELLKQVEAAQFLQRNEGSAVAEGRLPTEIFCALQLDAERLEQRLRVRDRRRRGEKSGVLQFAMRVVSPALGALRVGGKLEVPTRGSTAPIGMRGALRLELAAEDGATRGAIEASLASLDERLRAAGYAPHAEVREWRASEVTESEIAVTAAAAGRGDVTDHGLDVRV